MSKLKMCDSKRIFIAIVVLILLPPVYLHASMMENIVMSNGKTLALANTVTADPPSVWSILYNPAGLSQVDEGHMVGQNIQLMYMDINIKFDQNPNFEGFMGFTDDPLDGTEGQSGGLAVYIPGVDETIHLPGLAAPLMGPFTYREPGKRLTYATGLVIPYMGGFFFDGADNPMRYVAKEMTIGYFGLGTALAYQLTDELSFGLSMVAGISRLGLAMDMRGPGDMTALTKVLGEATEGLDIPVISQLTLPAPWFGGGVHPYEDDIGDITIELNDGFTPSFNSGLLYQPYDWLSFGLRYQSPAKSTLEGTFHLNYDEAIRRMIDWFGSSPLLNTSSAILQQPTESVEYQSGTAKLDFTFPQELHFGIAVKPFKKLKLLMDYHWANWAANPKMKIELDQKIQLLQLAQTLGYSGGTTNLVVDVGMSDTWHFSYGLEYEVSEKLKLRCGYNKRQQLNPRERYSVQMPFPDLTWYGVGAGLTTDEGVWIDVGLAYIFNDGYTVYNDESINMNSTNFTKMVYNPYAGLDVTTEFHWYFAAISVTMTLDKLVSDLEGQADDLGLGLILH